MRVVRLIDAGPDTARIGVLYFPKQLDCAAKRTFSTMNPPAKVILYTRVGCHLCDDAEALLRRHGLHPQSVDIDRDSQLVEQFDNCVPVVEIDGKIRFRGQVNEMLLVRLLQGREG